MKLWNCVHELVWNHKNMNSKYVLTYCNWNDFGYQTGFHLYMPLSKQSEEDCNIGIAWLSIVEHYPILRSPGRFFPIEGNTNFTSFICSLEDAERIFLFLTYDERMELIHKLNIKFSDVSVKDQGNYKTSTLRNIMRDEFLEMQQKIKEIVTDKHDVATLIRKHSSQLKYLL